MSSGVLRRPGLLESILRPDYLADPAMRQNVLASLVDGMYYSAMVGMTQPFLAVCAIALGATDYMVGLVTTLPALVAMMSQLPGAVVTERHPSLLHTTLRYAFLHRILFLPLAVVPFLPIPGLSRAWLYLAVLAVMNAPATICGVSWTAMMGQIYPSTLRGRIFGDRSMMCQFTTIVATLCAGWLIDAAPEPYNWGLLFLCCLALTMASLYYLTLMRVPARAASTGRRLASPREVLAQRTFVDYTIGAFIYHLGLNITVPVLTILYVRKLELPASWIGLFSVVMGLSMALTSRWWGRFADRVGTARALLVALAGLLPTPLLYPLVRGPWAIVPLQIVGGVFAAGFGILIFNRLLETSPDARRSSYVAVFSTLMMATGFAPMLGVALYTRYGFWGAFGVASALRLAGAGWLLVRGIAAERAATDVAAAARTRSSLVP
jgi:MFS family permease